MGLSVHYSGSIKNPNSLSELINEVKDVAEIFKWKYKVYNNKFPTGSFGKDEYNNEVYGISFNIPDCDTIFICFLSNGKMSSPFHLRFYANSHDKEECKFLYKLFVKTQFAGIELHKYIIHLFRHLNKKYFKDYEMFDEGGYWESGDEKLLQANFNKYNDLLNTFSLALENEPKQSGESFEDYFERLLIKIQEKRNNDLKEN